MTDYVFVHGSGQAGWVWEATIAALALQTEGAFGRALALDIPGCGAKRGRPTEGLGVQEIAAELVADIKAAGFADVVLVGHSQAGTVLPRMLELAPGLVRRAVYVAAAAPLPGEKVTQIRKSLPEPETPLPVFDRDLDPLERLRAMFCNDMTPDEAEAFMDRLGSDAWPTAPLDESDWRYAHLEATPASFIVCLRDAVMPPAWQAAFAERLQARRLVLIDAGHQAMVTRPQALAEALIVEANAAAAP
jgi:pimeloyl-ACP methyl ester carboxylesterase